MLSLIKKGNTVKIMGHQLAITWQHIRRSPYQAAAAIMIMSLTIFAGLVFFMLSIGSYRVLTYVEQRPQVIAFFDDSITSVDQVADLAKELKNTGKTKEVRFVSKEEALEIYRERNKEDPLLLELVSANTLPASLEVSAKNASDLPTLFGILNGAANIEDVSYQKDVVNTLITVMDRVRKFGIGLIVFLLLTSVFTVLTIIGMKIALRRKEIEVERLIGASDWYIRMPFLFEGLFYGIFAAVFSWAILYLIVLASTQYVASFLAGLNLLPIPPLIMLEILGVTIVTGALVGVTGSFIAVWHYLRAQN